MKSSLAVYERSIAALSAAGAAVLLRFLVDPVFGNGQPFIFVFPAVYLIGRRLGNGPALLTLMTGLAASDPLPVSVPVLMREMGNSPRGVSEGGA